jgi:hypothetical protein
MDRVEAPPSHAVVTNSVIPTMVEPAGITMFVVAAVAD